MTELAAARPAVPRVSIGAIGALVLLAVIWGGSIPATKLALADMRPLTLCALRYLLAAPLCLPILWGRPIPPRRALAAMLGLGALSSLVGQVCQVLGVSLTTASVATMISATIPILFALLASVRLKQPLRPRHLLGLICAFSGIVLIATGGPGQAMEGFAGGGLAGDALMLLSAVAVVVFYLGSTELTARHTALTVAGWTTVGSALGMIPVLAAELAIAPFQGSPASWAVAAYLGALVTVAGSWIWFRALATVPARIAASLQYLQPLVGVGLAAAWFGDRIDIWFAAGAACVFAGIALASAPGSARA